MHCQQPLTEILRECSSSGEDVLKTAFTDTSEPELLYSHCWQVKTRFLKITYWGVFNGKTQIVMIFRARDVIAFAADDDSPLLTGS